jgi:small subunit ribosomal protein S20
VAHSKQAIKRHRQSLRRFERNRARRGAARTAVRRARELIVAGNVEEAQAAILAASSILDRAASKGVLHPNNAARRKSRLVRQLHAAQASPAETPAPSKRRTRAAAKSSTKSRAAGKTARAKKS